MARPRTSLRLLAACLVLALPPLWGWWSWTRGGPLRREATVLVRKGATVDQIVDQLAREGVIRSPEVFKLWARFRKLQLIRGEYTLAAGASMSEVAGKLRRGEIHFTQVVIPPAAHAWSVQKRLKDFVPEDVFWTLWKSPRLARLAGFEGAESLEGLVAPATYPLHHAMEPEEVMLALVEAFAARVRPTLDGGVLPPYPTLILASLAEKESNLPEEYPRIAGVYHLRLRKHMRLQCDPTCLYARWLGGDLRFGPPLLDDLRRPHRFNTYTIEGLPPTPIAIPSEAAIAAAKAPLEGPDLYFVATGNGGHAFARNLPEHNRNVGAYRQVMRRKKQAQRASAAG